MVFFNSKVKRILASVMAIVMMFSLTAIFALSSDYYDGGYDVGASEPAEVYVPADNDVGGEYYSAGGGYENVSGGYDNVGGDYSVSDGHDYHVGGDDNAGEGDDYYADGEYNASVSEICEFDCGCANCLENNATADCDCGDYDCEIYLEDNAADIEIGDEIVPFRNHRGDVPPMPPARSDSIHWAVNDVVVPMGQNYFYADFHLHWGTVTPFDISTLIITLDIPRHANGENTFHNATAEVIYPVPPWRIMWEEQHSIDVGQGPRYWHAVAVNTGGIGQIPTETVIIRVRMDIAPDTIPNPGDHIDIRISRAAMPSNPALVLDEGLRVSREVQQTQTPIRWVAADVYVPWDQQYFYVDWHWDWGTATPFDIHAAILSLNYPRHANGDLTFHNPTVQLIYPGSPAQALINARLDVDFGEGPRSLQSFDVIGMTDMGVRNIILRTRFDIAPNTIPNAGDYIHIGHLRAAMPSNPAYLVLPGVKIERLPAPDVVSLTAPWVDYGTVWRITGARHRLIGTAPETANSAGLGEPGTVTDMTGAAGNFTMTNANLLDPDWSLMLTATPFFDSNNNEGAVAVARRNGNVAGNYILPDSATGVLNAGTVLDAARRTARGIPHDAETFHWNDLMYDILAEITSPGGTGPGGRQFQSTFTWLVANTP